MRRYLLQAAGWSVWLPGDVTLWCLPGTLIALVFKASSPHPPVFTPLLNTAWIMLFCICSVCSVKQRRCTNKVLSISLIVTVFEPINFCHKEKWKTTWHLSDLMVIMKEHFWLNNRASLHSSWSLQLNYNMKPLKEEGLITAPLKLGMSALNKRVYVWLLDNNLILIIRKMQNAPYGEKCFIVVD